MPCKVTEEQMVQMIRTTQDDEQREYLIAMFEKYYGGWGLYTIAPQLAPVEKKSHSHA